MTEFIRQVETTKTVEELSVELGMVIAYGKVIDLLIEEVRAVGSPSGRLDRIREYNEQQAVYEVLKFLRQDVLELQKKVGE
jgi:hypothetical protein